MLRRRIIPCLDVDDGRVVKGVNFKNLRDAGDPVQVAKKYDRDEADELCFLDITASSDSREIMKETVHSVAEEIFMPLTVGGGIRDTDDMRQILAAGADKISVNTAAVENPELVGRGAAQFGSQCVVVAIDGKKIDDQTWRVYTHGGREETDRLVLDWAREVEKRGAGEILLTSMDCDGTKDGFDLPLLEAVASAVNIPVIASGGAGSPKHFVELFQQTEASAGLAASIFHYDEFPVPEVKEICRQQNIPVRPAWPADKKEELS
ncbi:MAG: imidazole glycerol phosphate synthase subunit HisF [bacterium]